MWKNSDIDSNNLEAPTLPQTGPCTTVGNIRSFEIKCSQPIETFTLHASGIKLTYSKSLTIKTRLNGLRYDAYFENKGTSVVGREGIQDSLVLTINLADTTSTSITLHL